MAFQMAGYQLVHHGEGRWNGVAVAVRDGIAVDEPITNFGDGPVPEQRRRREGVARRGGLQPLRRGADAVGSNLAPGSDPIRVVSLYAPNGRVVGLAVLRGQAQVVHAGAALARRDARPLRGAASSAVTSTSPRPTRTSGRRRGPTAGPTSPSRSARASGALLDWGLRDAFRDAAAAGDRPVHLVGLPRRQLPQELRDADRPPAADRVAREAGRLPSEIDREARKGKPIPSDHAPLVLDLDEPGKPFDPGLGRRGGANRRSRGHPPALSRALPLAGRSRASMSRWRTNVTRFAPPATR